jgi:hypothetical protein
VGYLGAIIPTYDPSRAQVNITSPDRFSGDGSTVAFTLTYTVSFATDLEVFVDGVQQEPNEAYGVSGKTLTFTGAPGVGTNNIYVIYRAAVFNNYAVVPDGSITHAKLANNIRLFTEDIFTANGTGSTYTLTETPASANTVLVHIDGVLQSAPTNYTVSGTTLTFTSAPDASSKIVVKHLGFRTTTTITALQAGSVSTAELADGGVTNVKLAGSITSDKITSVSNTAITGNIISSQITSVSNTQITGVINTAQIADSAITTDKIAANAVVTADIADANVTNAKIVSVANTKITGLITGSQLANTAVTAGVYGGSSNSALITIDAQGRITAASNVTAGGGLGGTTVYTANATFTIPAGKTVVKVTVVGGGGGSGNGSGQTRQALGGGGGGTAVKYLTGLTPGNTLAVTVGAGGIGGASGSNGGTGGTSSVASGTQSITTVSATGGTGGTLTASGALQVFGTIAGGGASGGDYNISGSPSLIFGMNWEYPCTYGALAFASGGASMFAPTVTTGAIWVNQTLPLFSPTAGASYGGGATGASGDGTQSTAAGAGGIVIFEY